jgi:hypothetical protein
MQNLCPYKDNKNLKKLPCNWHFHPQDTNIRLCDCGNWYKTDELVDQYQNLPLVLIVVVAIIIVVIIANLMGSEPPNLGKPKDSSYGEPNYPSYTEF